MTAELHQLRPKPVATNWMCSSCGVDAGCNCGAPLMSKAKRVREYDAANPGQSTRDVADALGVNQSTVVRERQKSGDADASGETVSGRDGKQYPARRTRVDEEDEYDDGIAIEQTKQVFLLGAHEALQVAEYYGPSDDEIIQTARDTAAAWCRLVSKLTGERT